MRVEEPVTVDGYTIRRAHREDVPAVVALTAEWAAEDITHGQIAASTEQAEAWFSGNLWVAEQGAAIIAFASATTHTSDGLAVIPAGETYLEIDELYVAASHRSHGIGGALLEQVLQEASSQGITRGLVYSATKDWRRIIDFYQSHGYKMWYVQMYR